LEFDPEKREVAYNAAFAAIQDRQLALAGDKDNRQELVALQDAINRLNIAYSADLASEIQPSRALTPERKQSAP
jgi:hypothetical protein